MVGTHKTGFSSGTEFRVTKLSSQLRKQHVIKISMPNSLQYYELKRISSTRRYLTEDAAKPELVLVTSSAFVQIRVLQLSSHGHSQVCYSTDAAAERPAKYCCTPYSASEHHTIKPAHGLSYSSSTGSH